MELYSQNSNISHHLSATLRVSPSEHLILDSQQNIRQPLTLVMYVLQNQVIPLALAVLICIVAKQKLPSTRTLPL